jgi:hypothetical protein
LGDRSSVARSKSVGYLLFGGTSSAKLEHREHGPETLGRDHDIAVTGAREEPLSEGEGESLLGMLDRQLTR